MTIRDRPMIKRAEQRFERVLWRLRLVAILPVVMSLASTGVTFVLGTIEIGKSILGLSNPANPDKAYMARVLGGVVTGDMGSHRPGAR
jgi:uncharacterized membrane protein YqhA